MDEALEAAFAILESPEPSKEARLEALDKIARARLRRRSPAYFSRQGRLALQLKHPWNTEVFDRLSDYATLFYGLRIFEIHREVSNLPLTMEDLAFFNSRLDGYKRRSLLNMSSVNTNGYIREKAVDMLLELEDERFPVFLLRRLSDNVQAIRQKATNGVLRCIQNKHREELLEEFVYIEHLPTKPRVDPRVYPAIIDLLFHADPEFIPAYIAKRRYINRNPYQDRIIKKYLTFYPDNVTVLDKFRLLKTSYAWSYLLPYIDVLSDEYRSKLLQCPVANIRLEAFQRLRQHNDFNTIAINALGDPWYTIRELARTSVNLSRSEIAAVYLNNIRQHKKLPYSLLSLGEMGLTEHTEVVTRYLGDTVINGLSYDRPNHKVVAAAFRAMTRLAPEQAYTWALTNLSHRADEVRSRVINHLKRSPSASHAEIIETARQHIKQNEAWYAGHNMVKYANTKERRDQEALILWIEGAGARSQRKR